MRAREDYVKAIYQIGGGTPVRAAAVARYLDVSRVSVSKAKRLLESDGLIEPARAPSDPLALTRRGKALAIAMVRRHRLLETFLHRSLHVPLERVHAEAERIEHVISDDVALRIADLLGRPASDPHGHPIPYEDAFAIRDPLPTLAALTAGRTRARRQPRRPRRRRRQDVGRGRTTSGNERERCGRGCEAASSALR